MTDTAPSDETLIQRYARGDAAAFEELYERHELRVWRYLERNVKNRATADDLLQEVWFAVARDAPRYEPSARFTAWLFAIAHHRLIDSIRSSRRQVSLEVVGYDNDSVREKLTADAAAGPLASALRRGEQGDVLRALAELPAEQGEAFLLQIEGDLSVEEIAAITRSTFETVKSRLRYARNKLRELLKEHA
jgi:RNA polymerase sigma factor (sigma-70 family)